MRSRNNSARFAPPRSGDTTETGASPMRAAKYGNEELSQFKMHGSAAKCVLKGRKIVRLHCDDLVSSDRLEKLRNIPGRDRVAQLGLAVLARVAEVRHHRRDACCARLLQGRNEETESGRACRWTLALFADKAVNDVDVAATHTHKGPGFVFAILKAALPHVSQAQFQGDRQQDGRTHCSRRARTAADWYAR